MRKSQPGCCLYKNGALESRPKIGDNIFELCLGRRREILVFVRVSEDVDDGQLSRFRGSLVMTKAARGAANSANRPMNAESEKTRLKVSPNGGLRHSVRPLMMLASWFEEYVEVSRAIDTSTDTDWSKSSSDGCKPRPNQHISNIVLAPRTQATRSLHTVKQKASLTVCS